MPQPFRMPIVKAFPLEERLKVCEELGDYTDGVLTQGRGPQQRAGSGHRMLIAVWSRSQTTYGAVLALAREGDGDNTAMLARPLFEGMVDAHWIAKHPRRAEELAVKNYRLLRLVTAERYNRTRRPGDPEMPRFPEDLADRKELEGLFRPKAQNHWTALDLRRRLLDVDDRIPQDHENEAVERYEEEHFLSNLLLHGSPMAINDRITEKPGAVTVNLGPIRQHLANGLRHAYWSYYRTCLLAVGLWEGNHTPGLPAAWSGAKIERVVYCTARVSGIDDPSTPRDQFVYLRALRASGSVDHVEFGNFVRRVKTTPLATWTAKGKPEVVRSRWPVMIQDDAGNQVSDARFVVSVLNWEEKGSDVNVATHLLLDVLGGAVDAAVVVSNDSDLELPLRRVRERVPVGLVNPGANQLAGIVNTNAKGGKQHD